MPGRYIDSHNHMHALSWDEWELLSVTGMAGAVLSCGNPHVHREIWEEPPGPEDIARYWEGPLRLARAAEEKHFVRVRCALGVSAMTRVRDWEALLGRLPALLDDPLVAALGEVGLDPTQYFGLAWDLEDQARCLGAQARLAAERGLPVILHTPTPKASKDFLGDVAVRAEVPPEAFRLHYLKEDLAVLRRAGLDERLIVADHSDGSVVDFIHRETGAWCAVSIGSALRPIRPEQVVAWVKTYGPERILLNSDHLGYRPIDILAVPKTLRALRRAGVPEAHVRRVSFENANALFGFGL